MTNLAKLGSDLLLALLQDNNLSRSQLTTVLGYTSKTSIDRIAQENAGDRALVGFFDRIRHSPELVSKANGARLFNQMNRILGETSVLEWLMLFNNQMEKPSHITVRSIGNSVSQDFVNAFKGKENLTLYVHGCISPGFIAQLNYLIQKTGCRVYHYISTSDALSHLSKSVRCLFPIIFMPNYEGYLYEYGSDDPSIHLILPYNCTMAVYTGQNKKTRIDCIAFENDESCLFFTVQNTDAIRLLVKNEIDRLFLKPLVNNALYTLKNDYVKYLEFCEKLERDHAIYQYKPDFGFEQIPSHIIFRALREGTFLSVPGNEAVLERIIPIQTSRFENILCSSAEQMHVLKESGLLVFARTGMISDHFWGMRPLTIEERIEVFSTLIEHIETGANYHIFVLKDENGFSDTEITLYEDCGLSIIKPHTSYSLEDGHSETLLQQQDFCLSFKYFFLHELIPRYTMDQKGSLKCLKTILSDLKKQLKATARRT
ncbi:MAG: hypothetical protein IJ242_07310 [Clostridia bacterium]|nr:hypothetical protein [Clostridia bacterium]